MAASEGPAAPRALLLTAGLGTRLRPLTYLRAKAAVPVNGEPLIRRVIAWLARRRITNLVLNLHHHPESVTAVVGDGSDLGVMVRYSWEQPVLGSAGGPRHALDLLSEDGEPFLIVNGDTLTDLDVGALMAAHAASGAEVTMAVIPNTQPMKYGGVRVSAQGWITDFPRRGAPGESFHFIGVQAARPRAFSRITDGVAAESVGWLYPRLMEENPRSIAAWVCEAPFQDIGTPRDYLETSLALAAVEGSRLIAAGADIHAAARLSKTVVWDDVRIAAGATIEDCVLGDGVRIPPGARYRHCAIVPADGRTPSGDERIVNGLLIRPM